MTEAFTSIEPQEHNRAPRVGLAFLFTVGLLVFGAVQLAAIVETGEVWRPLATVLAVLAFWSCAAFIGISIRKAAYLHVAIGVAGMVGFDWLTTYGLAVKDEMLLLGLRDVTALAVYAGVVVILASRAGWLPGDRRA